MGLHHLSVRVASECGVNASLLFTNIAFWIKKNRENGKNFHDGTYWTYNSKKAFSQQFPYFTERQVKTALKKLEDSGYLKTGNYNKSAFDHTKWYALTEKGYDTSVLDGIIEGNLIIDRTEKSSADETKKNCTVGLEETVRSDFKVHAIPDINQIKNSDNNTKKERKKKEDKQNNKKNNNNIEKERKKEKKTTNYDSIINESIQDDPVKQEIYEFIKMRKLMKKPLTDRALRLLISKLNKLSSNPVDQVQILDNSIMNNWQGIFPLKNNSGYQNNNYGHTEVKRDGSDYAEFDY